jgi:hypothetical protein
MQVRKLKWTLLMSAPIFASLGCHVTSERHIVGTYRAEAPCETITLVVNADHTFTQNVRVNSGETNQVTGKWSINRDSKYVTFEPFLEFNNDRRGLLEGSFSATAEVSPKGIVVGSAIVKCPDSTYRIDYGK